MKKLIFILIVLSVFFMFAEDLLIERLHTPVWKTVNDSKGFNRLIDIALPGEKYSIVEEKVSWYFVEILTLSKHVGIKCWVWAGKKDKPIVVKKDGKFYIGQKGVTARSRPVTVKSTELGKHILNGSEIKIIKKKVLKVKVKLCDGNEGWVFIANGKIIQ